MHQDTETFRSSSKSPFRETLEQSIRGKYLTGIISNEEQSSKLLLEESSLRLRGLECNKIQIESENKAFLEQIGKLHAENKVLR